MKDRIPTKILPNGAIRYAEYDESGEFVQYRYMLLDDEPSEPGTPFNKASFFSDATAALYGLTGEDATVDGALEAVSGALKYGKYSQMSGGAGTTDASFMIPFTTEDKDEFNAINITTNPTRITIPSGVSRVRFYGTLRVMAGTDNTITLYKNGITTSNVLLVANVGSFTFYSSPFEVSENDYFELHFIRGGSGGNLAAGTIFGMEVIA